MSRVTQEELEAAAEPGYRRAAPAPRDEPGALVNPMYRKLALHVDSFSLQDGLVLTGGGVVVTFEGTNPAVAKLVAGIPIGALVLVELSIERKP